MPRHREKEGVPNYLADCRTVKLLKEGADNLQGCDQMAALVTVEGDGDDFLTIWLVELRNAVDSRSSRQLKRSRLKGAAHPRREP